MKRTILTNQTGIPSRYSLRTRLLLFFLVLSIVPMAIIGTISYIQTQSFLVNRIKTDLQIQTELQSTMLTTYLDERKDNLITLAGIARIRSMDPKTAKEAIDQYFKQWKLYENIGLYNLKGETVYRTDNTAITVADRPYFLSALKNETTISDPVISKASGNIVFVVASPVVENDEIVGVITGSIPTTVFKDFLNSEDLGKGDGFLLNKEGFLITPSNHTEALLQAGRIKERSELELQPNTIAAKSILAGQSGVEEYTDVLGEPVIGAFAPVKGTSWGLVMEQRSSEVLSVVRLLQVMYLVLIAAAILVVVVLALLISNNITKPILKMASLSKQISHGEIPEENIEINGKDEIALLARSFQEIIAYFKDISELSARLADGDLTVQVQAHSEKDILGQSFGRMVKRLGEVIREIIDHASTLDSSSVELAQTALEVDGVTNQIATTIQQVARGTTQQTESITHTASNVEDLSSAVRSVADGAQEQASAILKASEVTGHLSEVINQVSGNAQAVVQGSASAKEAARKGSITVQSTLDEMQSIKRSVDISSQKVQEMGDRSGQIGNILTTIEDIATQTNMLALNAAIEAARAGETGKGFAVVADEVRKLAERVSHSTHEIDDLIKGIQKSVVEANQAMVEGSAEMEKGVTLANQAGVALTEILTTAEAVNMQAEEAANAAKKMTAYANELVSEVDTVSRVVEKNSAATEEMTASTTEVTQAVENIASVSEENSAAAEEVSASTEEMAARVEEVSASAHRLSELSQGLRQVVKQFKVN